MTFGNSLCILDDGRTCMVSKEQGSNNTTKTLLGMQFTKGSNKHEPCYLKMLKKDLDGVSLVIEVPIDIMHVLKEFQDMMPKELPKKLPPRRHEDH